MLTKEEHHGIMLDQDTEINDSVALPKHKHLRKEIFEEPKSTRCKCSAAISAMPPEEMLQNLKNQPAFLIKGKWSPLAYIFLVLLICAMGFTFKYAIDSYPSYIKISPSFSDFIWRFVMFLYGACILLFILKKEGLWPLWSFTMMSWQLFTFRYLFSSLYHLGIDSQQVPVLFAISESLRFPSLVCNTITVTIWWFVLTPLIIAVYIWNGSGTQRVKAFLKFNTSPIMINIHFLNLPSAALDHVLFARELQWFDLWIGLLFALCYVLVYLFVMDRMGLYFYHVLLSPRPHWCIIAYIFLISVFVGYWFMWNSII